MQAQWLPSLAGRHGRAPSRILKSPALRSSRVPLACISVAVAAAIAVLSWSRDELVSDLDGIQLREDPNVVRFSAHCSAPSEGTEGALLLDGLPRNFKLRSVVVIASPGDTSAAEAWPGETGPPVVWDCEPQALPRYLRLNKHVEFKVVRTDGSRLDRSFSPDLLPAHEGVDEESSYRYPCGRAQLTGAGFPQSVRLGKHLADAYSDLVGTAAENGLLHSRSGDVKAALASTVGVLMALLAVPRALHVFREGAPFSIIAEPDAYLDPLRSLPSQPTGGGAASEKEARSGTEPGIHLLARWCHRLPWPCVPRGFGQQKCVSLEDAAAIVRQEEEGSCPSDAQATSSQPRPVSSADTLLKQVGDSLKTPKALTVLMAEGPVLAAVLHALLGLAACRDPLIARPPLSSRLALETWTADEKIYLRALWNGEDITDRLQGCSDRVAAFKSRYGVRFGGCDEASAEALFERPPPA